MFLATITLRSTKKYAIKSIVLTSFKYFHSSIEIAKTTMCCTYRLQKPQYLGFKHELYENVQNFWQA